MGEIEIAEVESFTLDHTKVLAPYVRLIGVTHGPRGDAISNFDLRLAQPNQAEIPTAGLHTIEHLIAALLRARIAGLIDVSPFGCRTGFHLLTWGEKTTVEIARALKAALVDIAENISWEQVPGTTAQSCGNYRDHSLHAAREWAQLILQQGISADPFSRAQLV